MKKKRKDRIKRQKLARQKFLREQTSLFRWARRHEAVTRYAVFAKLEGKWRVEFDSDHEPCRDSVFEILKLRKDFEIRRVNI